MPIRQSLNAFNMIANAAGAKPISGADGRALCRAIRGRGRVEPIFVERLEEVPQVLKDIVRAGDVVLTLGAGSIGRLAAELASSPLWQHRNGDGS